MKHRTADWAVPLLVAVVTFVAFLPVLHAGFVAWDDQSNFVENLDYRGLGWTQLRWMWTTFLLGHYVPLSWMTLGLDYVVWGMNPAGYHLTNLLLHCANAVVVYFLARRVLRLPNVAAPGSDGVTVAILAAFAALLFAVHPLRVESVAWITERRDVLSGLFYFSSLLFYFHDIELRDIELHDIELRDIKQPPGNWRWYWLAVGAFVGALLSKGSAVTLPAVLLIMNVFPLQRLGGEHGWWTESAKRVYRELVPFGVLAMAFAVMTFVALQHMHQLAVSQKIAVSAYSLAFYLWKTIAPLKLAPLYDLPLHVDPTDAVYVASYCVVVVLTGLAWAIRRRRPGVTVAWVLFVVILFPLLGVHQNGPQIAADRYTYNVAPVLAILVAASWASLSRPLFAVPAIVASAIVLVLGTLTWKQSEIWHDSVTMWSRVLRLNENSSIALTALGNFTEKAGRTDEAIRYYERSLAIDSGSFEAENNLGIALSRKRQFAEAIERYRRAVALKADYYEAQNNWGLAMAEQGGDLNQSIEHYRVALGIKPDYADAHVNWGNALVLLGNFENAIGHYRKALELRPDNADSHRNWGVALARQGKLTEAIEHFRQAIALRPDFAEAKSLLDRAIQLQRERQPPIPR
jgi:tetratricopeptide (TPR) repeat protein